MGDAGFCIYARNRKNKKPLYYVKFKLANGQWSSGKSSGETNREAARRWAEEQIDSGAVERPSGPEPTLDSWAAGFFGVGGRYDQAKRARGRQLSSTYLYTLGKVYQRRIAPKFGKKLLREITALELEEHFLSLYQSEELAGSTVNTMLKATRALFSEAKRLGVIRVNPAAEIGRFAENSKERGVLTQEELDKLFALDALETHWGGDSLAYLVAMLAVGCGLRHGEAVALRPCDIRDGTVAVTRAWNEHAGEFTKPKWGSIREMPAPERVVEEITNYVANREITDDALLFPEAGEPSRPVRPDRVVVTLRLALEAIGIPREEQTPKRRYLDVHALRHTFVSRLRAGDVPDWQIQRAAGHRSVTMTDKYTHANASDLKAVASAKILPFQSAS